MFEYFFILVPTCIFAFFNLMSYYWLILNLCGIIALKKACAIILCELVETKRRKYKFSTNALKCHFFFFFLCF